MRSFKDEDGRVAWIFDEATHPRGTGATSKPQNAPVFEVDEVEKKELTVNKTSKTKRK